MRTRIDGIMTLAGLLVIFSETLFIAKTPLQFAGIVVAILLISAGLWGLGRRLQPNRRIYLQLRGEVDQLLTLVRKINAQTVAAEGKQATETKAAMHESVDRIALVAGLVEGDSWEPEVLHH